MTVETRPQEETGSKAAQRISEQLDTAGWKTVTAGEFLGLTTEEEALIEVRLSLARALRERRQAGGMTQSDLAQKIGSSQSRIARVETGHPSVSLDLMVRAFLATGATQNDLSHALAV